MRSLPYRKPQQGRDYWVVEDALPNPDEVRTRCLASTSWKLGCARTGEVWPGMRTTPALPVEELATLDAPLCQLTGADKVRVEQSRDGTRLNHNCVQVVGSVEGSVKPHTDSSHL